MTLLNIPLILKIPSALTSITPLYPGSHSLYLIVIHIPLPFLLGMPCWFFFLYFLLFTLNTSCLLLGLPFAHSHDLSCCLYVSDPQLTFYWYLVTPWALDVHMCSVAYRVSSPLCPIGTSVSILRKLFLFLWFPASFYVTQIYLISQEKNIGNILGCLPGRPRTKTWISCLQTPHSLTPCAVISSLQHVL